MADDTRADEDEERAVVRAAQGDGAAFLRLRVSSQTSRKRGMRRNDAAVTVRSAAPRFT